MPEIPVQYQFLLAGIALGLLFGWILGRRAGFKEASAQHEPQPQLPAQLEKGAPIKVVVNGRTVEIPAKVMSDIQTFIQANHRIEAIKALRDATGLNLAAAKSVIASLEKII